MSTRSIDAGLRFRRINPGTNTLGEKLVKALESGYLAQRREDKWTQKKTFSPSSIGYGHAVCPRYWFLAFTGGDFVESTDAKGVAIMDNGTTAHARIQKALGLAGVLADEEVEITLSDPPIRGFMDVLIYIDDEFVVGEIKTTSDDIFTLKKTSMKPSPNHLFQILIYMKATGRKKGFLLYENRNTLDVLVIEVDFTEENEAILEEALDWMRSVYSAFEEGTLPKRPFRSQTVKVCQNCPLNKVCWEDNPEGVTKLPKMTVPTL